ncbi:MAG: methionine biosynthesis protein MetW [Deltaproteobacteria bacterium]|nr:methionine biosynthesis protein MetW [Deltaproteobacteria bacterium]
MSKEKTNYLKSGYAFNLPGGAELDPGLIELLTLVQTSPAQREDAYRWQDKIIFNHIPKGSYVLDLGCGRGQLLSNLIKELDVRGQGVEVDPEAAMGAMELGVPVLNIDVSEVLGDFRDQSFDFVILESTIQTLKEPIAVLDEMLRVGRRGVVSFPNFGHWRIRFYLSTRGRMPVSSSLPYYWYDTPNIHLLTFLDFMDWCRFNHVRVAEAYGLNDGSISPISERDNLMAEEVLVFLSRD